jgi:signal peptidase I
MTAWFRKSDAPKPPRRRETPMEFTGSMAVIIVTGLFIITFNLQAFEIPSTSMEDTLLVGDHVFVDRVTYAPSTGWMPLMPYSSIRRGDIVVFLSPSEPGLYVVKRIIGIPGDRLHLKDGVLYRNGERVEELYVKREGTHNPYRDDFPTVPSYVAANVTPEWRVTLPMHTRDGELVVPPGNYFAMGDNREVSLDSRYWGFIPRENIIGRPMFIYWSFDSDPSHYARNGLPQRIVRFFSTAISFPTRTRWERMFQTVR